MLVTIREANAEDVDVLVELNRSVHDLHVAALPGYFRQPAAGAVAESFRARLGRPDVRIWIASTGDVTVGYLVGVLRERPENAIRLARRFFELEEVGVAGARRRQGVAKALIERALAEARLQGVLDVELTSWAFNTGAHAAFRALGFRSMIVRFRYQGDSSSDPAAPRSPAPEVTLQGATVADATLLSNLMELYVHDLSAMFPHVTLGEDGRYGYPELPSYLSGVSNRWAFVIRHEGRVAGFALARRGSPASDDPSVLDIAELFVLRRCRGRGVGRAAVARLWDGMPGSWAIRAAAANPEAVGFWRTAVAEYAGQRATESERSMGGATWVVFCFDNAAPGARSR